MEEKETTNYAKEERRSTTSGSMPLPPHNNLMIWSILATLLCCLVGGVIAIIYSATSNTNYSNALMTQDDYARQTLYYESEKNNKTARTWIIISIVFALLGTITTAILISLGVFASAFAFL